MIVDFIFTIVGTFVYLALTFKVLTLRQEDCPKFDIFDRLLLSISNTFTLFLIIYTTNWEILYEAIRNW